MVSLKKDQQGFTLVELIVVMAILALLVGLAVPRYTSVLTKANSQANAANLKLLQDAVDLYIESEQVDPSAVDNFEDIENKGYLRNKVPDPPKGYSRYVVSDGVVENSEEEASEPET